MVLPFLFPLDPGLHAGFFPKKTPGSLRPGVLNDFELILFCCSAGQKLTGEFFIVFRRHLFGEPFQCQIDGFVNQVSSELIFSLKKMGFDPSL